MFIRYNIGAKYYEYDTSAGQDGSGPWVILPLDGNITGGLPANIAYTNIANIFTQAQRIQGGAPTLALYNTAGGVNGKQTWLENFDVFYISHINDAGDTYLTRFSFDRSGNFIAPGIITANSALRAGAGIESRGNNAQIIMLDANGPADLRTWRFLQYNDGNLHLELCNEGLSPLIRPITIGTGNIVNFNGNYTVHAGGAHFPTASTNPLVLDHYEEGTYLPTMITDTGGVGTGYSIQLGYYTKVGRIVTVGFDIQITAASWSTGNIQITVPFINSGASYGAGSIGYVSGLGVGVTSMLAYISPGSASMYLAAKNAATGNVDLNILPSHIVPGTRFIGSITYGASS